MKTYDFYADLVEASIANLDIPQHPAGLYDPVRYILEGGGKRMRPVLTVAACDACGAEPETALNQAVALEMFHNFTLLHDDVMDKADMRRGRPTVHIRWNEATAILSGDAMLTLASRYAARCDEKKRGAIVDLFNRTALEVYEGQQYDMDFEERLDVTEDEYIEMIRLKTSVLLGCACRMGALVAGADDGLCDALYSYGELMGLAFQLRDDLLDTYGDPIVFGKRVGGDILNDKKTWLLITAIQNDPTDELKDIILSGKPDGEEKIAAVKSVYDRLGVRQQCERLIERYSNEAIEAVSEAGVSPAARDFFVELARKSITRLH